MYSILHISLDSNESSSDSFVLFMHITGLMKNCVNTLQQVTHVHFDFATPQGLEITLSDKLKKKREREEREKEESGG